ncbi:hypothetical protein HaLaN_00563 [Haematococcus lacustris]|uniref:Bifunctional inhibitor/plant lipid transfer protein/seed storage helical domain-containing protein n=1 Tax=Haematococcus lacustris TaxID=44745 RepID=A0A699YG52_HAELA|nr:hypothetical protein HaLaN_00563 [Haematococcus lacustris]
MGNAVRLVSLLLLLHALASVSEAGNVASAQFISICEFDSQANCKCAATLHVEYEDIESKGGVVPRLKTEPPPCCEAIPQVRCPLSRPGIGRIWAAALSATCVSVQLQIASGIDVGLAVAMPWRPNPSTVTLAMSRTLSPSCAAQAVLPWAELQGGGGAWPLPGRDSQVRLGVKAALIAFLIECDDQGVGQAVRWCGLHRACSSTAVAHTPCR